MTTHKLTLYSEKLAQHLERVKKGSDEREAMRQVIKKEKNERPEMVYLHSCATLVYKKELGLPYPIHLSIPLSLSLYILFPVAVSLVLSYSP
jgi:hypothetical protein